jgi:hypothetical protein
VIIVCLSFTGRARVSKKAKTVIRKDIPITPLPIIPITFSFLILLPSNPRIINPASGRRIVKYIKLIIKSAPLLLYPKGRMKRN